MAERKYFGTDGVRGRAGEHPITPEFVLKLGWAAGKVLAKQGKGSVLIAKDTRISNYMFAAALESGLSAAGLHSHLLGPMPTPGLAYLTRTFRADAGIMISASHNPYYDNGIKFFSQSGTKLPDSVELEIEAMIDQPLKIAESASLGKARRMHDAPGRYIEFCKSSIPNDLSLNGLKIVLDCANGATYHIAPAVFRELGADVVKIIGNEPNGVNINLDCGSTVPDKLQAAVQENGADLGVAFDGDGDRLIMCDHKGELLDGDELLFIIASDLMQRGKLSGLVGTQMTNLGLEQVMQQKNIPFLRTKVGDRYVIEALKQHNYELGGETSGHIICMNRTTTGDGIVAALQVIVSMLRQDKPLHDLKRGMQKMPQVLVNVPLKGAENPMTSPAVKHIVSEVEQKLGADGRVLLRPSGTEPLVRVMVEGVDATLVERYANEIAEVVASGESTTA